MNRVLALTTCFVLAAFLNSVCSGDKTEQPKKPVRVANGSAAPELDVAIWSDGKQKHLSDFRGKVVVLHFWGSWCVPCADKIPLWQRLRLKYPKDEVVFLGIHTAGTELDAVKEYMKKLKWEQMTAIDKGGTIPESSTFRKYGISGVDQIVVITRNGVVHCNGTSRYMEGSTPFEMEEKLGLKKASSREEQLKNALAIFEHIYSKEIDDALKQKSPPVKQRARTTQTEIGQTVVSASRIRVLPQNGEFQTQSAPTFGVEHLIDTTKCPTPFGVLPLHLQRGWHETNPSPNVSLVVSNSER